MFDRSAAREGGFTVIEIVIAVAVVAATVAAGFGVSLASRSLAVSTAAGEFDQFLDSARTMARDLDGVTLAFTPDAFGDGTEVRLFAGGPNGQPTPTTLPILHARATIDERESLGKAPFAFIVHATGSLSGRPGYRVGDQTTNDVGCPASGAFHFVIQAAGESADRFVPCRLKLAASGPATLTTWPLTSPAPSPTPCSGTGCTARSLPTMPPSVASCPPNYTDTGGGCAPPASAAGARYHVTINGAPSTIGVGTAGAFTAQATLMNPSGVAPGTPASIPVGVQTADVTCAATPSGWQSSGSTFAVSGIVAGTCTVTAQADASGISGATTDTATATFAITASPTPAPSATPSTCDLVSNSKCYHRIVDPSSQAFYKYTLPDTICDTNGATCSYVDSIRQIFLEPAYGILPTVAPIAPETELLFRIDAIESVTKYCEPYASFATIPGTDAITWTGSVIGGPNNPVLGFGEPSVYATVNHVVVGTTASGSFTESDNAWPLGTHLGDMFQAVALHNVGMPVTFTFSSPTATAGSYVQWYPDLPGCDVISDPNVPGPQYGIAGFVLEFEVYQASSN